SSCSLFEDKAIYSNDIQLQNIDSVSYGSRELRKTTQSTLRININSEFFQSPLLFNQLPQVISNSGPSFSSEISLILHFY
ncbi:hypothetical protein FRX31_030552, partial [Thalictrum thalictroides]